MRKVAHSLVLAVTTSLALGCSVYKSSDREDFDSHGKDRAAGDLAGFAFNDLCSVIDLPKALLENVDELTVVPSITPFEASQCTYKARGRADSLRLLICELSKDGFESKSEAPNDNSEFTFSAKSATSIGFLKCSIVFDGLAGDRSSKKYEEMSEVFAHFQLGLTLHLSGHPRSIGNN